MTVAEAWGLGVAVLLAMIAWHVWTHSSFTIKKFKSPTHFHVHMMGDGMQQFKENTIGAIETAKDTETAKILEKHLRIIAGAEKDMLRELMERKAQILKERENEKAA